MARIIEDKLLFIHVAKTGGTFVRESLGYIGMRNYETGLFEEHDHIGIMDKELDKFRAHLISFGVVRKPFEWLVSRWKWGMYTEFGEKIKCDCSARKHWMADVWSNDLNTFLFNVTNKRKGIATEYMFTMLGLGGPWHVDHVLTCENLNSGLEFLYKKYFDRDVADILTKVPKYKERPFDTSNLLPFLKPEIEAQNHELITRFYKQI